MDEVERMMVHAQTIGGDRLQTNALNIEPYDIVILHVGGALGSYGPIDSVLSLFPRRCVVFGFEARDSERDEAIRVRLEASGVRSALVNTCIADACGRFPFFLNKYPESSSMFPPAQEALDEHTLSLPQGIRTWRENTELDRVTTVDAITLCEFVSSRGIEPDVVSIDAQGMELRILQGAGDALESTSALVTEVEFSPVYSGQGLFDEQFAFLNERGFRLADLLNSQQWHPAPVCGQGFLTVAEALWLKRIPRLVGEAGSMAAVITRGLKGAAVAVAFGRYSYAYAATKELLQRYGTEVERLAGAGEFDLLVDLVSCVDANLDKYRRGEAVLDSLGIVDAPSGRKSFALRGNTDRLKHVGPVRRLARRLNRARRAFFE